MSKPLTDLRVLVLEDEYLIAMDVEQLCRDSGAKDVAIMRGLDEIGHASIEPLPFDVAIVDLMLGGASTLDFARWMHERGMPFVFASGYGDLEEIAKQFPGIAVINKPYAGDDLVNAVAAAVAKRVSKQPRIP